MKYEFLVKMTRLEWANLIEARDFVLGNSDGAEDQKRYTNMSKRLDSVFKRATRIPKQPIKQQ